MALLKGSQDDIVRENARTLRQKGLSEAAATQQALQMAAGKKKKPHMGAFGQPDPQVEALADAAEVADDVAAKAKTRDARTRTGRTAKEPDAPLLERTSKGYRPKKQQ